MHPILCNSCLCLDSYNISPAVSWEQELWCILQVPPTLLNREHYRCSILWWLGNDNQLKEAQSWKSGHDCFQVHTLTVLSAAISVISLVSFLDHFPPEFCLFSSHYDVLNISILKLHFWMRTKCLVPIKVWPFFSQFTLKTKLWLEFFSCKFCSILCYLN